MWILTEFITAVFEPLLSSDERRKNLPSVGREMAV
jgi:hypothetical protein